MKSICGHSNSEGKKTPLLNSVSDGGIILQVGLFRGSGGNIFMETHNMVMVPVLLVIAGIAQVVGSICLLFNKQVVICALGFAAMIVIINLNLHDFWNVYEGVDVRHETQNFIKNLGVFVGFLMLAAVNMKEPSSK